MSVTRESEWHDEATGQGHWPSASFLREESLHNAGCGPYATVVDLGKTYTVGACLHGFFTLQSLVALVAELQAVQARKESAG